MQSVFLCLMLPFLDSQKVNSGRQAYRNTLIWIPMKRLFKVKTTKSNDPSIIPYSINQYIIQLAKKVSEDSQGLIIFTRMRLFCMDFTISFNSFKFPYFSLGIMSSVIL